MTTFLSFWLQHHDSCSVQRRLFLISSSNGFSFHIQHKNHATVYFILDFTFFPLEVCNCLALGAILFTMTLVSCSFLFILPFNGNPVSFFLMSWSSCFIFEPCIFILIFVFIDISSFLSFPSFLLSFFLISVLSQYINSVSPFSQRPSSQNLPVSYLILD